MLKIAVVGDVGVDYYKNLKLLKPGGIAFNFTYNLKKSGVKNVSLISILGSDKYSLKLLKLIKKIGIITHYVQSISGNCPKQNILLKTGERKFIGYDPGVLKKWKLRKKDLEFIKKHDAVFVPLSDGMEHIFNAIKKLKGPVKVVDFSQDYEFADFNKKENVITKNAKYFDVIFIGGKKKHQKMVEVLAKKYPEKVFVLTLGSKGSIGFYKNITFNEPAKKLKVIDTTGAGDAFQAGFLLSWIKTKNVETSLQKGSSIAAKAVGQLGSASLTIKWKN